MKKKLLSLVLVLMMLLSIAPMSFAARKTVTSMKIVPWYSYAKTTLKVGETTQLDVQVMPLVSTVWADEVEWKSGDPSVLKIDSVKVGFCEFKALKPGKSYVTATAENGVTAGIYITVLYSDATAVTLAGKTSIKVGETTQWKSSVTPADANPELSWSSGNPDVATVDANGNIKGLKEGQSNITATAANGVKKNVLITVTADPAQSIAFAGKTSIKVGQTTQWGVVPTPANASKKVTWASGNPGVATVDANGNITGHKSGQAHITATAANGVKKTVLINVVADPATAVNLAGAISVMEGKTIQWKATVAPSTANQIVTWKSGNPGVATVDQNGNITGHKSGQAHITATAANGIKKTVLLTVSNNPTSVTLAGKTTIPVGESTQWKATVAPTGVNQWVSWTSGNPDVATVDANGNITALKEGQANITATTINGLKKTVMMTVIAKVTTTNSTTTEGTYSSSSIGTSGTYRETTTKRECTRCYGSGTCYRCYGLGWVDGTISRPEIKCTSCRGNGRCFLCKGTGYRN